MPIIQLRCSDTALNFEETGTGIPVVFLHAFPLDCSMWQPQREALSNKYRVLCLDLPGFGGSTVGTKPFTIDGVADGVAEFLDVLAVKEQIVLGGLSMGGYIALAFARRHASRLRALVLANTRGEPDDDTARINRDKMIAFAGEHSAAEVTEMMLPRLLGETTRTTRPEVVESIRSIGSRQTSLAIVAALRALRDRPDAVPGLAAISVPTLVIAGMEDAITTPEIMTRLAQGIPGSKMEVLNQSGHLSNRETPEAFNHALQNFLQGV